jgi:endo-1,4-beta-xylanase
MNYRRLPLVVAFTFVLLFAPAFGQTGLATPWPEVEQIMLWPKGAPGSEGVTAAEHYSPPTARSPHGHLAPVHYPSLFVFLPPKEIATGAAIMVCPGGGDTTLTVDHEGRDIALWLNKIGVAAFVVKYRLAKTPNFPTYTHDTSMGDVQRALRLVRSRAADWNVDPQRIGLMGFSAGGTVCANAGVHFDAGKPDATDPIERVSSRPDFQMLIYPGAAAADNFVVPKDAPPVFLAGTTEDAPHAESAAKIYLAYLAAKIPAELHIYNTGAHGFALEIKNLPVSSWNDRLKDWLGDIKMLGKK